MINNPKIVIQLPNKEKEYELFSRFFNHQFFKQHRNYILNAFPKLNKLLKNFENEESALKNLIDDFYAEHESKIEAIIQGHKAAIEERRDDALQALSSMMEYEWEDGAIYTGIPTILPFCPFEENRFYFSILTEIKNQRKENVLYIAIHEISHFVFFDYLSAIEADKQIQLGEAVKYFLKESLTTALFNTEPLKNILGIDIDSGNPELRELFIQKSGGAKSRIVDWIKSEYLASKELKEPFLVFLAELTQKFNSKSKEFEEKKDFWNKHGYSIFENKELLEEYKKPVEI